MTSVGSLVAAGVAVFASSCCALPLGLVMLGVSGGAVGALIEPLHAARLFILAASVILLALGWMFAARRRASRVIFGALITATALFLLALGWRYWDPPLTMYLTHHG